jgi:hypothetical protein
MIIKSSASLATPATFDWQQIFPRWITDIFSGILNVFS